jgi:hypothetical protein
MTNDDVWRVSYGDDERAVFKRADSWVLDTIFEADDNGCIHLPEGDFVCTGHQTRDDARAEALRLLATLVEGRRRRWEGDQ